MYNSAAGKRRHSGRFTCRTGPTQAGALTPRERKRSLAAQQQHVGRRDAACGECICRQRVPPNPRQPPGTADNETSEGFLHLFPDGKKNSFDNPGVALSAHDSRLSAHCASHAPLPPHVYMAEGNNNKKLAMQGVIETAHCLLQHHTARFFSPPLFSPRQGAGEA